MTLLIYCKDGSRQLLKVTEAFGMYDSKSRLSESELESRALGTALSIVGGNYDYHVLDGFDQDDRELKA